MDYLQQILKTIHLIGVVVWFSGLFYLGRLFVYHREAFDEEDPAGRGLLTGRLALMERRLWRAITVPGMVVTLVAGALLLHFHGFPHWIRVKLGLVALLVVYHVACGRVRHRLLEGGHPWTDQRFRLFNEVPTLLLVAIVSIAVFRQLVSLPVLGAVLLGLVLLIGLSVRLYARVRARPR